MECLEGDSYAAIKQKLTEEEQQTIDCEETNDQYVWVHGLFEKVWEEIGLYHRRNTKMHCSLLFQLEALHIPVGILY